MRKAMFLFLFLVPCVVWGQEMRVVTGRLADTTGQGVKGAIVVLMEKSDSVQVRWDYFAADTFRMEYEYRKEAALLLYVSAVGYTSKYVEVDRERENQGTIVLEPLSVLLDEAVVAEQQPIGHRFIMGNDIYTIPDWLGEREYDVMSLLSFIPGLVNSRNGIEIAGIGAPIYKINGLDPRPGELSSMDPRDIASVTVIRMPSAAYSKGVRGIVNITTRKKWHDYIMLRVGNNFACSNVPTNSSSTILNFSKGKYSQSLMYSYGIDNSKYKQHDRYETAIPEENIYYVNFIIPPTNEHIVEYVPLFNSNFVSARANFCVSMEGNAYAQIMGMAGAAFENPINTSSRGGAPEYKVAPYVGVSMARPGNSNSALFYDVDNRRFVGWRYNSTSDEANQLLASLETEEAPRFSWTTGMDLVYMESTRYSNGLVYAILQDESGKRVVYGINMSGNAFVQEAVYDNLNAPDFDKATTFAFHSQYPFMFYGVGNKVYLHNLGMNRTYEMTNIALGANEEVTMLKFNLYQYGDLTLLNNQSDEFMARQFELMVGSYDSSIDNNNGGRLGFYMVNPDNSVEKRTEYSGFAKIVDVVYRERI